MFSGLSKVIANTPRRRDDASVTPERLTGMIVGIGFVSAVLVLWLVVSKLFLGGVCPDLLGIPACFAVLGAYVTATGAALFPGSRAATVVFYLGAGTAMVIAVWLSSCQVRGTVTCPAFEGLPMCFTSLVGSTMMLALDLTRRRLPRK